MVNFTPFLPGLPPVAGRSQHTASLDVGELTSSRGLIVQREATLHLDAAGGSTRHIPDHSNRLLVRHSNTDMVLARAIMIAAGHEDCDYIGSLKSDLAFKVACECAPETGTDLMSQPKLSRIENVPDAKALYRRGVALIDLFLDGYMNAPTANVLDIDDIDDLVSGGQQLDLFNTIASGHCFQPTHFFEANSGKPLVSLLREGERPSGAEIARVQWHVIHRIRRRWPKVGIYGHYCAPDVINLLHRSLCNYILARIIHGELRNEMMGGDEGAGWA